MVEIVKLTQAAIEKLHKEILAGTKKHSGSGYVYRDDAAPQLYVRTTKKEVVFVWYGWSHGRARSIILAKYPTIAEKHTDSETSWLKQLRIDANKITEKPPAPAPKVEPKPLEKPKKEIEILPPLPPGASLEDMFERYYQSAKFKENKSAKQIRDIIETRFMQYPDLEVKRRKKHKKPKRPDRLGLRKPESITRAEMSDWQETIAAKVSASVANRCLSHFHAGIIWLEDTGKLEPGAFPRLRLISNEDAEERLPLPVASLRALWQASHDLKNKRQGAIIRLLILTGQRKAVIAGLRWSELTIDGNGQVWLNVPKERSKAKNYPYKIPLMPEALAILKEFGLRETELAFPTNKKYVDLDHWCKERCHKRMTEIIGTEPEHWVFHNIRKNFRNLLDDLEVTPYCAEILVGHKIKYTTNSEGRYLTKSFEPEMVKAMKKLTPKMLQIVEGDETEFAAIEQLEMKPFSFGDERAA